MNMFLSQMVLVPSRFSLGDYMPVLSGILAFKNALLCSYNMADYFIWCSTEEMEFWFQH